MNDDERPNATSTTTLNASSSIPKELQDHFSSEKTKGLIKNLTEFFTSTQAQQASRKLYLKDKPTSRIAAVLVLIFEREGHLRVLLTTRAKRLAHGGETCLPGGHMEDADRDIMATAHREAYEEVSLPLSSPHIHTLGILEPHPFGKLIVIPVVALLTDNSILHTLKRREKEVECIFSHPLEAILDPPLAGSICGESEHDPRAGEGNLSHDQNERLVKLGSKHWPHESRYRYHKDYVVQALGGMTYRLQCFQTCASPITGMTADVLIHTAEIVYQRSPQYERYAFDQLREYDALIHRLEVEAKRTGGAGSNSGSRPV